MYFPRQNKPDSCHSSHNPPPSLSTSRKFPLQNLSVTDGSVSYTHLAVYKRQPYTIAYGMTECGPIICHSHWTELKLASCGKVAARMEAKVLSPNPAAIAGELVCRGANLMWGYYKNEEATRQVIDLSLIHI